MAEEAKKNMRSYSICAERTIELGTKDPVAALKEEYGDDAKLEVYVRVGRVVQSSPKRAVEVLGGAKDLEGKYAAITDSAITSFPPLKTETKRSVTFEEE